MLVTISFLAQVSSLANEIIVKPGETLSSLANYYNVSIESLINANNLDNPDNLRIGQKLIITNKVSKDKKPMSVKHTIKKGETIQSISVLYKISKRDIIKANNLQNPSLILEGQSILIPSAQAVEQDSKEKYHFLRSGETLYGVSRKYNVPVNSIIELNQIEDPNNLRAGLKILLARNIVEEPIKLVVSNKEADWREYGDLKINWTSWKKVESNSIALSLNKKGKPLYLAVNCYSTKLNWKKVNGQWNQWFAPKNDFEFNLLDDLCENSSEI